MQQVFGDLFIKLVTQMSHVSNMTQITLLKHGQAPQNAQCGNVAG